MQLVYHTCTGHIELLGLLSKEVSPLSWTLHSIFVICLLLLTRITHTFISHLTQKQKRLPSRLFQKSHFRLFNISHVNLNIQPIFITKITGMTCHICIYISLLKFVLNSVIYPQIPCMC